MVTLAEHSEKAMRRARDRADAFCAEHELHEEITALRAALVEARSRDINWSRATPFRPKTVVSHGIWIYPDGV